jgi:hypothetical protein
MGCKHRWTFSALLLCAAFVSGCASSSPGQTVYQQGRNVVLLEDDPAVTQGPLHVPNTHPAKIQPVELASVLREIGVRSDQGIIGTLLSLAVPAAPVFDNEELDLLAPILSKALAQARPDQRVAFTYWSAKPVRRNAPLAGAIAVNAPYLRFTLDEHPTIGWQDPEDPAAPKLFELEFVRPEFMRVDNEDKRKRSRRSSPSIEIDYVRVLKPQPGDGSTAAVRRAPDVATSAVGSGDTAVKAPAPAARQEVDVEDLRREIKELTLSNQELRAKVRELSDQLAETKQLLGEKVLELDRLNKRNAVPRRPKAPGGR